jgi:hypothetical protein
LDFGMTWDVLVVNKLRQPDCQLVQNLFKKSRGQEKPLTHPRQEPHTQLTYEDTTSDPQPISFVQSCKRKMTLPLQVF